ncbi:MAG: hypothetical protein ACPGUV_00830 [Polyangiales bacterium]
MRRLAYLVRWGALLSLLTTGHVQAHEPDSHATMAHSNVVGLRPAHIFHRAEMRHTPPGAAAAHSEHLYGVIASYERVLLPERLALELCKPLYVHSSHIDSPFELLLKLIHRYGGVEVFVGAGLALNLSVTRAAESEDANSGVHMALGPSTLAGLAYILSTHWALELDLGYAFLPSNDAVAHEFNQAFGLSYLF